MYLQLKCNRPPMVEVSMMEIGLLGIGLIVGFIIAKMTDGNNGVKGSNNVHHIENMQNSVAAKAQNVGNIQTDKGKQNN